MIGYDAQNQLGQGTTTFVDMFSYETYGAIKGKRLWVIKTNPMTLGRTQTATGDLNMSYAHDNEGKVTAVTYPTDAQANITPQYNYQYDAMSRPSGMSDQNSATVVSGVLYEAANELLSMNYDGGTETRSYNAMFQLTGISGLGQNITYNFPAGSNNGKIASQYDAVSGETVSYQHDSLNRLISASAAGWSQSYSYDGFGNLTNRVGSGAAVGNNPTAADPATNRLVNAAYDANGNMLSTGNVYDVENRLMQAAMAGGTIQYAYDGQNKRIWQGSFTNSGDPQMLMLDTVSMFGADGQLAGTYTPQPGFNNTTSPVGITFAQVVQRVYFGRKLIKWLDGAYAAHNAVQDRLGSVGKYYPYGEERNSPPMAGDQVKFATYTRDAATGNDYADQRYYGSTLGRFMTPDPYKASGGPVDPKSWNRYSYTRSDPINKADPSGLDDCDVGDPLPCTINIGIILFPASNGPFDITDQLFNSLYLPLANLAASLDSSVNRAHDAVVGPDLKRALAALDKPDCAKHFGTADSRAGAWDPKKALQTVFSDSGGYIGNTDMYVRFKIFPYLFPFNNTAQTGPAVFFGGNTRFGFASGFRVEISANQWNLLGDITFQGIGEIFQAATLLHELGHIFSFLSNLGSGGSDIKFDGLPGQGAISDANEALILKDCFGIQ